MKIEVKGRAFSIKQIIALILYYKLARYFPSNGFGKKCRYMCVKHLFARCGKNVNIEKKAIFGSGLDIVIGDNSGIGINCCIPSNTIIGKNVMMGPNCYIFATNHRFDRTDIPMIQQGFTSPVQTIIEDDVWIGRDVLMTPGRNVKRGSIIAGGCVLCKDFPPYSIIGGNPSRLIRSRLNKG